MGKGGRQSKRTTESVLSGGMLDSLIEKLGSGSGSKTNPGFDNDTFGFFSNNLLGRKSEPIKKHNLLVPVQSPSRNQNLGFGKYSNVSEFGNFGTNIEESPRNADE